MIRYDLATDEHANLSRLVREVNLSSSRFVHARILDIQRSSEALQASLDTLDDAISLEVRRQEGYEVRHHVGSDLG